MRLLPSILVDGLVTAGSSVTLRAFRNQTSGSLSLGMDYYLKSALIKRVDDSRSFARTMR